MKIENGKEYIFNSKYEDLARYNGTKVYIQFSFIQVADVPNMYRAMFADGRYYDVYEDELTT